jgi:hypothetical protein
MELPDGVELLEVADVFIRSSILLLLLNRVVLLSEYSSASGSVSTAC